MKTLFISFFCLLVFSSPALAGPPLLTSDTGTPGDGQWEINVGLSLEKSLGHSQVDFQALDINYGLGERVQLKFGYINNKSYLRGSV